jgi:four helix bundle protein
MGLTKVEILNKTAQDSFRIIYSASKSAGIKDGESVFAPRVAMAAIAMGENVYQAVAALNDSERYAFLNTALKACHEIEYFAPLIFQMEKKLSNVQVERILTESKKVRTVIMKHIGELNFITR